MNTSYKKQAVKRYVKIEKIKYRKYHIKDFNLLIKLIYPKRVVLNPYHKLLEKTGSFSKVHLELIKETTANFTILNELHRDQDKYGRLYTVREDLNNAIYFLQNELKLKEQDILLNASTRWFYHEIHWQFYDRVFTSKEVALQLRKAKSTVYHHLTELKVFATPLCAALFFGQKKIHRLTAVFVQKKAAASLLLLRSLAAPLYFC